MTFYIGGDASGSKVERDNLHLNSFSRPVGPFTGFSRATEIYVRRQISFHGTVKSFYLLKSESPIAHRDLILELWDQVDTDIFAI